MSQSERGLEGWHVCGVDNQLFYSENPVVKISDTEYLDIENANRDHWSQEMRNAHKEVRSDLVLEACMG